MKMLEGKVAVVTGGTRGIGFAIVKAFLEEGATVILTASNPGSAEKAVSQLKAKYPEHIRKGVDGKSPQMLRNLQMDDIDQRKVFF